MERLSPTMFKLISFCAMAALGLAAPFQRLSVTCTQPGPVCKSGTWDQQGALARAVFNPSQNETGWATLFVETTKGADDGLVAFAAGYVEGFVSAEAIYQSWQSFAASGNVPPPKVQEFVSEQATFAREQAAQRSDDPYWRSVLLVYRQLEGISEGYNASAALSGLPSLSEAQLTWLNMNTELGDIRKAVDPAARPDFESMDNTRFEQFLRDSTHCSALFRVTPELDDLLVAHTTWTNYFWMLRVYKAYQLRFSDAKAETVFFSGYPGEIPGIDDFYETSQKLVVLETTNNVFNNSLYGLVKPQTLPYWVRVTVANRLATNAQDWHDIFYRWNSGTYNNQWMVADFKKFEPRKPLPPWTFSVSEQIPGPYFHPGTDMTTALQNGHWSSYNVPYFQDVYEISGYPRMVEQRGPSASYQLAPRAPIFRRDGGRVNAMEDLRRFMRENNYGTGDPLAKSATHAIAARCDLLPEGAQAFGAIDAKVVNAELVGALAVSAIAGPTTQGQPPFEFSGRWTDSPHFGMPTKWDFGWQSYSAEALKGDTAPAHGEQGAAALVV